MRRAVIGQDYGQEEERELSPANQLGLTMIYYLQAMQHVDQLCEYRNKGNVATKVIRRDGFFQGKLLKLNFEKFNKNSPEVTKSCIQ